MGKAGKQLLLIMILCTLMISILPITVRANSAEPPSLVILINNPPDDLSIVMVSNVNETVAKIRRVAWEGYYVFYSRDMQVSSDYTFRVTTNGQSFECKLDGPLDYYNNVATLDVFNRELTPGKYPFRAALLVLIRLLLTLMLEGMMFLCFRFRQKKSWLIFFAINLVTQVALNVCLNSGGSLIPSYLIFDLIIGEFFVFTAEMIAFPLLIKEHKKSYTVSYAIIANFISLIAGSYIISILPV